MGYPSPTNRGPPKSHLFDDFTTLTAYILGTKQNIDNLASVLQTTRRLLYCLKTIWTLVHKWLKMGPEYSPTLRQLCVILHCRAWHMHFRPQDSTKICHKDGGKNVWSLHPANYGGLKTADLFSTTSQLNGKFNSLHLRNDWRQRQSGKCVGNWKGSPTSSRNAMNFGPLTAKIGLEFSPTIRKLCFFRNSAT